ncbi:hypothetical protein [Butyrivibrio sp. MC2013]|uniref:hypothetical protein n=1 Tax=Butyrivibrio sp. MC2013 TaxID=1280686 RepID=UPI000416C145|nr:hypothetical protein [Butyrivibrio sp. MC2013]
MHGPFDDDYLGDTYFEDRHGIYDIEVHPCTSEHVEIHPCISYGKYDDDDDNDELSAAGLKSYILDSMAADERREALEDAGLDPDDYSDRFDLDDFSDGIY